MKKRIIRSVTTVVVSVFLAVSLLTGCASTKNVVGVNSQTQLGSQKQQDTNISNGNAGTGTDTSTDSSTTEGSLTGPDRPDVPKTKDIKVHALYLTGWTVGSMKQVQHYIDLAKTTEINSYVIDIKDDDGLVGYKSSVPDVQKIHAWENKYDADKVLKAFHDNGIPVIGRIVCFKDPYLSSKRSDLAIKDVNGGPWRDRRSHHTWLNPYNQDSWPYLIAIAREAVQKGFDEIQFDYVRFSDGNRKTMDFGNPTLQKYEAIDNFLAYAKKELPGVTISGDVFGIITESPADTEDIGQNLEYVGRDIDYISPMVYPSHYALGQIVNKVMFPKPDFDPYGVVYNALVKCKNRISAVKDYKAQVRPYLQDFTATWLGKGYYQQYGPEQVRQQIKAVYDAGYDQWILWDASNTYSEGALLKKSQ